MNKFRFAILGAGGIGGRFCDAVSLTEECEICAVASKSLNRARDFARRNGIEKFYGSYEEMLSTEKPDCAYIAVTPNDHSRLAMMCLEHDVPVLCEKAMFQNSQEAVEVFEKAKQKHIFVMEAMWSRFLPAVNTVREWVAKGYIGIPELSQFSIGFVAPEEKSRYLNPALGGGVAKDITVYAYELSTYILDQPVRKMSVSVTWGDTGVDISNHVSIDFAYTLADLAASFVTKMEERMVIYGREGKIVLPNPHFSSECFLYNDKGELKEHFADGKTRNGFIYEIKEAMHCIQNGQIQSEVIPWKDTLACAELFDKIEELKEVRR